jgi:tetratricopeptide (TPR) repeat protein
MKMYDEAICELEEILNQHPEFGGAYKNLASCYRRKKIFGKAIDYFKLSMEYEPNADLIKGHLLDTYLEAGQAQTAKTFANELIARQSQDHETYHSKAIAYSRLGNYSKAIDFYELALEEDATCLFCLLDLSEALKQKGDLQAAIKPLQKFRTFLPTSIMALERLIDLHVELEQFDKAIEYAMLRINVSPTTNRFHSDLGDIYLKTGELQLAEGAFLKAQSLSSNNNIYSLIQLFKIYQQQDKLESAESALRRAVFINTTSVSAHHNLVKFLMSVQRHDEARSAAKEFLKRCPQSIWAQHWNVETLAAIGDADGAMQAFEQGLAADKIPPRMFTPTRKIELEKKLK